MKKWAFKADGGKVESLDHWAKSVDGLPASLSVTAYSDSLVSVKWRFHGISEEEREEFRKHANYDTFAFYWVQTLRMSDMKGVYYHGWEQYLHTAYKIFDCTKLLKVFAGATLRFKGLVEELKR